MHARRLTFPASLVLTAAALLAPAVSRAQQQVEDPVPLMVEAVLETRRPSQGAASTRATLRAHGIVVPEERATSYKLAAVIHTFHRAAQRVAPFTRAQVARPPLNDADLVTSLAKHLGVVTTHDPQTEERACGEVSSPEGRTRRVCRYSRTDEVIAVSVPFVTGDTARVDVRKWFNPSTVARGISFHLVEVTLVRRNGVWTAVSRRVMATVHG